MTLRTPADPVVADTGVAGTGVDWLVGRDDELAAIAGMLRGTGGGGLLVVGGPGAGKSALLHAAADLAARDGRTVLRAAGVPAEAGVPYAGLHQLLYPLAGAFESLAPRPREVLRAAFGHAEGPAPDMFPAAVATLEVLAGAAAGGGLLVVADDLHWMDDATLGVLRFVARRPASRRWWRRPRTGTTSRRSPPRSRWRCPDQAVPVPCAPCWTPGSWRCRRPGCGSSIR